jgi:alkanesulfonate monooxygenase SsuD/methylene tetrahydromethanopterin reductase-like flavin-dependent oxidoreductase (luciferase family)
VPGTKGDTILEWARRADAGPFSSLGVIDRLVYDNYEPLVLLSAAAGATSRVRLLTCVLLAPLRNAGVLAKQAASLDAISGGRLTLGLGVGRRHDDYRAAPAAYENRGRQMNRTLSRMRRIWNGEGPVKGVGPVGPTPAQPGGPEVLIGAGTPQAASRVGKYADGFIAAGNVATVEYLFQTVLESWEAEGRPGKPRLAGVASYALGPNAADQVGATSATTTPSSATPPSRWPGTPYPPRKRLRTPSGIWKASEWTRLSSCRASPRWTSWSGWPT